MLRTAVAQIACVPGDIAANCAMHRECIEQARDRQADILLFPELSLPDYLSVPDCDRLALTSTSEVVRALAGAARGIAVSFGFIERADGGFHNSQALVRDGAIVALHRKLNLPTYGKLSEGRYYQSGGAFGDEADIGGARIATLICADLWNPALPWLAALRGSDILLAPVASALDAVGDDFDNPSGWDIALRHTAMMYGTPILFANHCGARGGLRFWGGSRILDPVGRELARAGDRPELIVADLDPEAIRRARARLPTVRDADPALIARELSKMIPS